jgi:hypothetical protein
MQIDAMEIAVRIVKTGEIDNDASRWLIDAFNCFFRADGCLTIDRCLGFPATRAKYRRNKRDEWLRNAARHIQASTKTQRAMLLYHESTRFQDRIWPRFCNADILPSSYQEIHHCLFFARKCGSFPEGSRQYRHILNRSG